MIDESHLGEQSWHMCSAAVHRDESCGRLLMTFTYVLCMLGCAHEQKTQGDAVDRYGKKKHSFAMLVALMFGNEQFFDGLVVLTSCSDA